MKKKLISGLLCVAMVVSMLIGCGSDSAEESSSVSNSTDDSTFVIAKTEDATTMDPALQTTSGGIQMLSAVGEGLVRSTADGQSVEGCLATEWKVSDDGLTYTFTLLPDLKFSDGNDVTLEDWQFTFERAATVEDSFWNYVAEDIAEVTEPEEGKLQITLKEASASFLAKLAMFPMYVQEKAHYDEVGDEGYATDGAIMAGPFAISEYKQGEYLMLEKNEYYHDVDKMSVDNLKIQLVADDDSRISMLEAGEIDVAENIPAANFDVIDEKDGISAVESDSNLTKYLILNTTNDMLQDVNVRKAISLAIDKEAIVTMALSGHGETAVSYMSRYGQYYNSDLEAEDSGRDVEEAKRLLKEAGYADGFDLEILIPAGDTTQESIVTIIKENLAEVGINVTQDALDDAAYVDKKYAMEHQACIATWIDDMIDPDGLNSYWWDISVNNAYYSGYESDITNELYVKTKTEMDATARAEEFAQLQEEYYKNVVSVPLYNSPIFLGISDSVSGFQLNPLGAYYNIAEISK